MSLARIIDEMRALVTDDGDPESEHHMADDLLCEAVRELAPEAEAEELVAAWRSVRRWYS